MNYHKQLYTIINDQKQRAFIPSKSNQMHYPKTSFVFSFLLLVLFTGALSAQTIQTSAYLPYQAGDTLIYQLLALPDGPPLVRTYTDHDFRGQTLLKAADTNGAFRLETFTARGWEWSLIRLADGTEILLDQPLPVLPGEVEQGQIIEIQKTCTLLKNAQKTGQGKVSVQMKVEGIDSAHMPFRNFEDCLTLTLHFKLEKGSITVQEYTEKMWLAPGIGLVKGVRQMAAPKGVKPVRIPYELSGRSIRGASLEGRRH